MNQEKDAVSKCIFDKQTASWFQVSKDEYEAFERWRRRLRHREQYHGRCTCSGAKWWLCDGMCQDCKFHRAGDTVSLETPVLDENGEHVPLREVIAMPHGDPDEIIPDRLLSQQILKRLSELMPEAAVIGEMRLLEFTDEEIADILGIKRSTFLTKIEGIRSILREEFREYFDY